MDNLANLENAVNIFYKTQSTDQAQLNEFLMAQQRNPMGKFHYFSAANNFLQTIILASLSSNITSMAMVMGISRFLKDC